MSYIVPNSNKPVRCNRCPFIDADSLNCTLMEDSYKYIELACQHIHCPLINIPTPHGRLGDLDKLWNRMYNYIDNEGAKMPYGDNDFMIHRDSACELIEDAPTVVEGSEI